MTRLDQHMVEVGLASSRSKAVHLIKTGEVLLNGTVCRKQSCDVKAGDVVHVVRPFKYVSRAGYKIEAVFKEHKIRVQGCTALDVGCSAGGFSDFFLQEGARRVVGIDIATGGVASEVLANPKFHFFCGVDAKDEGRLQALLGGEQFDLISVDVSRAILEDVLPAVAMFLAKGGLIIALFKPPYELNRCFGTIDQVEALTDGFESWLQGRFDLVHRVVSPIKGGCKNRGTMEVLYVLRPKFSLPIISLI